MKEVEKLQEKREKRRLQQQELREKRAQVCNRKCVLFMHQLKIRLSVKVIDLGKSNCVHLKISI